MNLYIVELAFYLMPVAFLAQKNRWRWDVTYSLRPAPLKAIVAAALAGAGLWIFNATMSTATEAVLTEFVGPNPGAARILTGLTPLHAAAFILAAVVLAPFSEEVFFRGMMQNAYYLYGERQALILVSLLFGLGHALNSISAVIPATLLGFATGVLSAQNRFHMARHCHACCT